VTLGDVLRDLIDNLLDVTGLPRLDVLRIVDQLVQAGVLRLR